MNEFDMQDFASHLITGKGKAPVNDDSSPIHKLPSNYSVFNGQTGDDLEFGALNDGVTVVFNLQGGLCLKAMRLEVGLNEFEYWLAFADCHVTPESGDIGFNTYLKQYSSACSLLSACFNFYEICICEFSDGLPIGVWKDSVLKK